MRGILALDTHGFLSQAALGRGWEVTYQVQAPGGGHGALRLPAAQASIGVQGVLMGNTDSKSSSLTCPCFTQKPTSTAMAPPPQGEQSRRRTESRAAKASTALPPPLPLPGTASSSAQAAGTPSHLPPPTGSQRVKAREVLPGRVPLHP